MAQYKVAVVLCIVAVFAGRSDSARDGVPSIPMYNGAQKGQVMPGIGFGTGGGGDPTQNYGQYPECWGSCNDPQCALPNPPDYQGCGQYVQAAVTSWLQLGGRRIDSADSYRNQANIGRAILESGVPRSEIFFATKVGASLPMGYADSHVQFNNILNATGLDYVDILSVHWPSCATGNGCNTPPSADTTPLDPACDTNLASFDEKTCRLNSYRALVEIFESGKALAIGVSNFNATHIQEIIDANLTLPTANQISFNPYHSTAELELRQFCESHKIIFNSWSPFARPDSQGGCPPGSPNPMVDPVITSIASAHNATPAQVILAWQWAWNIPANPRSQNAQHMVDNLNFYNVVLTADEMTMMNDLEQVPCGPPYCSTVQE